MLPDLNVQTSNYRLARLSRQREGQVVTRWKTSERWLELLVERRLTAGREAAGNHCDRLFGAGFPLRAKSVMEPLADPVGKRKELAVTIKFDGLLRRVVDHLAVMAALEMDFQHLLEFVVHVAIQIARKLLERIFTFHECLTSFQNLAQLLAKAKTCPEQARFDGAFG